MSIPQFISDPDPDCYLGDNYLVLDFEVSVRDGRYGSAVDARNSLALACWSHGSGAIHSNWGSEFAQSRLAEALQGIDFIVGHNLKFEYGWLARCGIDTSRLLGFDTQIAEYVLLGNNPNHASLALDACCTRRGWRPKDPIVDIWMKHGIPVERMPPLWVSSRCRQDVRSTRQLFLEQRDELKRSNRLGCLLTRCILTPVLASIEAEKIHLDKDRVREEFDGATERLGSVEREISEFAGGINWRSPKQTAAYLYDTLGFRELSGRDGKPKRTANGGRLTDAKSLLRLKVETDAQRRFLDLKKAAGQVGFALSKNLNYFKEICDDPGTGDCFTAEFNQSVTATHRLSCSGVRTVSGNSVQLQNVPRDFKRLFNAKRDGWLIGEADGAQLEFRVAAFLGNDSQAKRDISDPEWDAHCVTAAAMTQKPYEQVYTAYKNVEAWAKRARQDAKSETFKPLYGGSKGTKAQERWYEEFKRRYPDLARVQQDWVYEVLHSKSLKTPWGLRYYFPNARVSATGYCNVTSSVYNYPIQALATAEIIPIAVTHFWHTVRAESLDNHIIPVNTVHDSLVCEIHPDHQDDFIRISRDSFGPAIHQYLSRVYGLDFDVPLGVGIHIGTHWGTGEELKFEYLKHEESK